MHHNEIIDKTGMPQLILSFVYNIINKEQGFAIIIRKQNKNDQKTH